MKTVLPAILWSIAVLPATAWAQQSVAPAAEAPWSRLPLQHDADPGWNGIGVLQLLLAGLVLAAWIGWLLWRRKGWRGMISPAERGGLRLVQSTSLTARASVHVVRWDGREWLLGCTEHGITPLAERARPAEAEPQPGTGP